MPPPNLGLKGFGLAVPFFADISPKKMLETDEAARENEAQMSRTCFKKTWALGKITPLKINGWFTYKSPN